MSSRGHGSGHGFSSSATSQQNQEAPLPPSQPLTRLTPCSRLLAGHDQALERECLRQAQRAQRHPRLRLLRVVLSASPAHALAARATRSRGANRQRSERVECRDFGPSFGGPLIHDGVCVRRLSGAFPPPCTGVHRGAHATPGARDGRRPTRSADALAPLGSRTVNRLATVCDGPPFTLVVVVKVALRRLCARSSLVPR